LSEYSQRLAIYGLGGCGKTALALEYAYWTKEQYPMCAVFWVSAMSRESFEQAYYDIAMLLRIPSIEDDKTDVKRLVKARLDDEDFGQWLIIIDNADNVGILLDPSDDGSGRDRLIDYLPQSSKGSIIFTTRTRGAAAKLAEDKLIALGELDMAEATELLTSRLVQGHRSQVEQCDTFDELFGILFFHALAIVQAIAFINTNDISLSDYIALYRNSDRDAIDLLSEEFDDQSRYPEATNAVTTTWYISFEQIQKQNPIAADHLFFMACTASNDIDPSMFPHHYTQIEHVKAMGTLKTYSFVIERPPRADRLRTGTRKSYTTFDIHPLVHLAIRSWLKAHHKWDFWIKTALARFIKVMPYGDHSTQNHWSAYIHHAMHVAELPELYKIEDRMTLLERIASCERSQGRYQAAERVYRQALEQRQSMSGKEHPDTLMTMGNIGLVLGHQREWTRAENIHQEVLRLMKKVSGERHPLTITAMGNLALVLLGQRKYAEAEKMYRESYLLSKEVQGMKHPDTLTSMSNLGIALTGQKKYSEAEQLLHEALDLRKEVQGVDHADTMSSMSALGTVLRLQFKYVDTESLHREELALRKKLLGVEHPNTIISMHNLGLVLCAQKKYDEAEHVQKEALALSQKVSGKEDPSTLANMSAIAHTLHTQKKYAEAERMHRETLVLKERRLGWEHPDTLTSVYWLASLAQEQNLYEDALPLYERAYTGFLKVLGEEHSTTLECRDEYEWVQRVVEEDRATEAAKLKPPTQELVPASSQGSGTVEAAPRSRERWREKMKKWRTK
jgi:tetratricopeptide (TPR) repeat protein